MEGRLPDPAITAAVVSWNTRELLDRCLASLRPDAEAGLLAGVVVVDNGSGDGSPEMVEEKHPWARLIRSGGNLGFGAGANLGLAGASTEWLLVANADIELEPGALRRLLEAALRSPRTGIASPRLLDPDGTQQPIFAFPRPLRTLADMAGARRLPSPALRDWIAYGVRWDPEGTLEIEWGMGAALLIRAEAFAAVGGFDPRQWMYAEDLDLAWRLRREGWRSLYVGDARVIHACGSSSGQAFSVAEGRQLVNRAYYDWVRRRLGPAAFWAILGLNLAGGLLRLGAFAALARAGSAGAASRRERYATKVRSDWRGAQASRREGSPQPPG